MAAGVPWTMEEGGGQEALRATVPGVLDELDRLRAVRPLRRPGSVVA